MEPDRWLGAGPAGGIDAGGQAVGDALRRCEQALVALSAA